MDGRQGMTLSGAAAFYLNRRIGGSSSSSPFGGGSVGQSGVPSQHGYNPLSNPNFSMHSNPRDSYGGSSAFHVENPSPNYSHGIGASMPSVGGSQSDPVKKKRGRPRKYGPDGANMSLGLSPMPSTPSVGSMSLSPKRARGRPPGSGRKQRLASLGDWMNNSAGMAFTPHVILIGVGEDVAAKILSFAQLRPRALCVMTANGAVSTVSLRQPTSSGSTVTYEGRFEILCLSGSYLIDESGGPRSRTGGISISICSADGQVIGGAVGGRLIAATLVQVVVCSFVYGDNKLKVKPPETKYEKNAVAAALPGRRSPPLISGDSPPSIRNPNSITGVWPPGSRPDLRNPLPGFDLTRG